MSLSDNEILSAIKSGDDDYVLKHLYKKNLPKVKKYIKKNSGNDEDAFDIFQDAMMAFYRYVKENKFNEKYEIDGFIYSVSRNLWINKVKKDKRNYPIDDSYQIMTEDINIMENIITVEKENILKDILDKLGERCKELLTFAIYNKMSLSELAEKLGFANENAVKTKKYKCKQRLLKIIEDNPGIKDQLTDYA